MGQEAKIKKEMTFGEVLKKHPETVKTFFLYGMHCFGCHLAVEETIEQGTTNKITLIPTLMELGYLEVADDFIFVKIGRYHRAFHRSWVERVYDVYFCQEDNKFIGEAMKEALL